ncbi:GNAT family N-acetyltransferase [Halobacillus sp. BAB-2008]|uniref:GNAT family N-acetyltransferase n=1 Tax=Halobacillus sp. BAB-2008 TaxID=1246484 RepID=UPI0002A50A04|nr:GNAT family N-acetyltransferase [Halobacillus sp. BAB-2008]ELK48092.1 hypothetical protein D479_04233 [Halobacillus sp. BAB-2008]
MQTLNQVKVMEYEDRYAAGIAKMWNESRDEWGGDSAVTTEEDVMEKEGKSSNLNLFLAVIEEEVVGYCGLSEYREDKGALYIPLLNVHPDYHGKKIGKMLLKKAIDQTVAYGWPRLDLFTWPGNTKAVPLYKKCGFFWEDRDDTTHLMNFLPSILQLEMLKPFFEKNDWYETSSRLIEVRPDGIEEGKHTCYEYKWEADGSYVRVQFERTGRKIRLVETERLLVEMTASDFRVLEGGDSSITYRIRNYDPEPLTVHLRGAGDTSVRQGWQKDVQVSDEWKETVPLDVEAAGVAPNPWQAHPVAGMDIELNGCMTPLRMGFFPVKAGRVRVRTLKAHWLPGEEETVYLDLESEWKEPSHWTIHLPNQPLIDWEEKVIRTFVEANGRCSVPVPVRLVRNGCLEGNIHVTMEAPDGESLKFTSFLHASFPGKGAKFGGESDTHMYAYNGPFFLKVEKRNHIVEIGKTGAVNEPVVLMTPKLGLPYTEEFSKKMIHDVEFIELPECIVLKTTMISDSMTGLRMNVYMHLHGDGLVKVYHELINEGLEAKEAVSLLQPVYPKFEGLVMPVADGALTADDSLVPFVDDLPIKDLSENWLFTSPRTGETTGYAWSDDWKGRKDDWKFSLESYTDVLHPGEACRIGPLQIGIQTDRDWLEWRRYSEGSTGKILPIVPLFDMKADSTAMVGGDVVYTLQSRMNSYLDGTFRVERRQEIASRPIDKADQRHEADLSFQTRQAGIYEVKGFYQASGRETEFHKVELVKGAKQVEVSEKDGVWTVQNGVLAYKASSAYFPGIFSLVVDGREFLHHQYPQAEPKSWWNPWGGGLRYSLRGVNPFSILKEETRVTQVKRTDQEGSIWEGICLSTTFQVHKERKGTTLHQYMLTLPEVPVVAAYADIEQDSGRTFTEDELTMESFWKPSDNLDSCYAVIDTNGPPQTFYAGVEEFDLSVSDIARIGSKDTGNSMTMVIPEDASGADIYMNKEVLLLAAKRSWRAADKGRVTTDPSVLMFGEIAAKDRSSFPKIAFRDNADADY